MEARIIKKYAECSQKRLEFLSRSWCHLYIRLRDTDEHGYGNCISCEANLSLVKQEANAGHYWESYNYPRLRHDERNINLQCVKCNNYKGGNQLEYRKRLVKKLGSDTVEALDNISDNKRKFEMTLVYYASVIEHFKREALILESDKMFEVTKPT